MAIVAHVAHSLRTFEEVSKVLHNFFSLHCRYDTRQDFYAANARVLPLTAVDNLLSAAAS